MVTIQQGNRGENSGIYFKSNKKYRISNRECRIMKYGSYLIRKVPSFDIQNFLFDILLFN